LGTSVYITVNLWWRSEIVPFQIAGHDLEKASS